MTKWVPFVGKFRVLQSVIQTITHWVHTYKYKLVELRMQIYEFCNIVRLLLLLGRIETELLLPGHIRHITGKWTSPINCSETAVSFKVLPNFNRVHVYQCQRRTLTWMHQKSSALKAPKLSATPSSEIIRSNKFKIVLTLVFDQIHKILLRLKYDMQIAVGHTVQINGLLKAQAQQH